MSRVLLNPQWLKEEQQAGELLAAEEKWRTEREKETEREIKTGDSRERERYKEREKVDESRRAVRRGGGGRCSGWLEVR